MKKSSTSGNLAQPFDRTPYERVSQEKGAIAGRLEGWLTAHITALGVFLTAVFAAGSIARALSLPIWFDEIYTRTISRFSPAVIWQALVEAVDNQPYPFYLVNHYSQKLFGDTLLAIRLPEIVGFACMGVCIFLFMRKRVPPLFALSAAILPLASGNAYYYATDGRPYGMELGFCGLILIAWQAVAAGRNRRLALAGLALSVAGAVSSHYFSVLILVPVGIAELVRIAQNRRADLPVACAILIGLAPLLAFAPHIAAMHVYRNGFWAHPTLDHLAECFRISAPIAWIGVAFLCVPVLAGMPFRNFSSPGGEPSFPLYERAAAAGLFLLPLIGMAAAPFTGVLAFRYVLPTVVGASLVCGMGIAHLGRRMPALGLLFIFCMTAILAARAAGDLLSLRSRPQPIPDALRIAAQSPLPVVVDDGGTFLAAWESGDPSLNSHLWFIADPEQARRFGDTTYDQALMMFRKWANLPVVSPAAFLTAHPSFEIVVNEPAAFWRIRYLRDKGATVRLASIDGQLQTFQVDMPLPQR